jgi:hypothetical protein
VIGFPYGGISDGHHRCADPGLFFFPEYARCKNNFGDPLRTVCPHCPKRFAALLDRFHLFSLARPRLSIDCKRGPECAFDNLTKTEYSCRFHAISDDPYIRYGSPGSVILLYSNIYIIQLVKSMITNFDSMS